MPKNIAAGKKFAKAIRGTARFGESREKGTPYFAVTFGFTEESTGEYEMLEWTSWITPKTLERTIDTLAGVLGFNGNDSKYPSDHAKSGYLTDLNALDYDKEISITVSHNEKGYPQIQWVNNQYLPENTESINQKLDQIGFKAAFLAKNQGKAIPPAEIVEPVDDNIPF